MELRGDLVLILAGDHLYKMDYREMLRDHLETEADITLAVLPCSEDEIASFGAVRVDRTGRIVEFREKPGNAAARAGMEVTPALLAERGVATDRPYLASMGIYLFRKETLQRVLANQLTDFGHHVIPHAVAIESCRVQAHFFKGYWRDIGTIRSYFDAHMDLILPEAPFDFYDHDWPFFTHPRYLPGSRVTNCSVYRSVIADGNILSDCELSETVIGVRSIIRDAKVRRSLVIGADRRHMGSYPGIPPVGIGRGSVIENAIIDKNVRIGRNVQILNEAGVQDGECPYAVIRDGIVVVPHNTVIPDGTVI
jgi:glucose-1-phosphate adenylyltransferase